MRPASASSGAALGSGVAVGAADGCGVADGAGAGQGVGSGVGRLSGRCGLLALCAGCTIHINPSAGITTNDSFHYSTYDNAADYTAGRFTYQAEDIRAVRVYWVAGSIDLIEKNSAELSVSDSADNRSQEAQLHSLLRDGILTIHYCASDYRGEMQSEWKQLTIEIPSGIELTIENVSAPIRAAALSTPQLHIATVSGDISIDSLVGE